MFSRKEGLASKKYRYAQFQGLNRPSGRNWRKPFFYLKAACFWKFFGRENLRRGKRESSYFSFLFTFFFLKIYKTKLCAWVCVHKRQDREDEKSQAFSFSMEKKFFNKVRLTFIISSTRMILSPVLKTGKFHISKSWLVLIYKSRKLGLSLRVLSESQLLVHFLLHDD